MNRRIIARLDVKGPNLVKGIHLEGLRVLGDPAVFAEYYSTHGADELLYMDVVASLYERNSIQDLISATASRVFIPITVGGGLRTLDDIREVLRAGADKVSLNTAAIRDPEIISAASRRFGRSTIAVTIEAIRSVDGQYFAYVDNGREKTGREVISWAQEAAKRGAGEIVITSVDREGTGEGYDLELTRQVANAVNVPVVASGGAGGEEDVASVLADGCADAAAVASVIHYDLAERVTERIEGKTGGEGNTEFMRSRRTFSKIRPATIDSIKKHARYCGISVRIEE